MLSQQGGGGGINSQFDEKSDESRGFNGLFEETTTTEQTEALSVHP